MILIIKNLTAHQIDSTLKFLFGEHIPEDAIIETQEEDICPEQKNIAEEISE